MRNWIKLKIIACRDLGLTEFPTHALDVETAADVADFSHNCLTNIPSGIDQLVNLKTLDCTNNQLTSEGIGTGRADQRAFGR